MTLYFIAETSGWTLEKAGIEEYLDNYLRAINAISGENNIRRIKDHIDLGKNVLIDSGVFDLAKKFSQNKNISLSQAFSMDPTQVDGFEELFDKYVQVIRPLKDELWGYIEIDLGCQKDKTATRKRLKDLGLNPIPVYHFLTDSEDYLDFLCQNNNRICIGNLAQSNHRTRIDILSKIEKKRKQYPDLFIHFLGLSLSPYCFMFQIDSCDSSEFSAPVRWNTIKLRSLLAVFSQLDKKYMNQENYFDIVRKSAFVSMSDQTNMDNYQKELNAYK